MQKGGRAECPFSAGQRKRGENRCRGKKKKVSPFRGKIIAIPSIENWRHGERVHSMVTAYQPVGIGGAWTLLEKEGSSVKRFNQERQQEGNRGGSGPARDGSAGRSNESKPLKI